MSLFRFLLGAVALIILSGCEREPEKKENPQRTIDPSQITIDVKVGGVLTPDQVLLQFKKTGSGDKVLIVPSLTYLSEDFKVLEHDYTVIYYDARNRGRSQVVKDPDKLAPGVWNDVQDLEAIRRHFQTDQVYLVGHAYFGFVTALYARRYPEHVAGLVMISPLPPVPEKEYANRYQDSTGRAVRAELAQLEQQRATMEEREYCRQWWEAMKKMYMADPLNARKIRTNICQYPNEHPTHVQQHLQQYIYPSLEKVELSRSELSAVEAPVLILHGDRDRIAPLEAARDWRRLLPDAELVEIENAGHLPWIEGEEEVFDRIRTFVGLSDE